MITQEHCCEEGRTELPEEETLSGLGRKPKFCFIANILFKNLKNTPDCHQKFESNS